MVKLCINCFYSQLPSSAKPCSGCCAHSNWIGDGVEQPAPTPNDKPAIWPLVIEDMNARDNLGRQRYGTPLQPDNGRDMLKDAYEEALDLACYLRGALYERDGS